MIYFNRIHSETNMLLQCKTVYFKDHQFLLFYLFFKRHMKLFIEEESLSILVFINFFAL